MENENKGFTRSESENIDSSVLNEDLSRNTQPIPRVTENMLDDEATRVLPKVNGSVRELEPVASPRTTEARIAAAAAKNPKGKGGRKKFILLAAGFVVALFIGFVASGYYQDHKQAAADKEYQIQQLAQQKEQLEREKQQLEQQQQSLREDVARLEGKNQQLEESKAGSVISGIVDKITGQEDERQQAQKSNTEKIKDAVSTAESVGKSVQEEQQALDKVNGQLDQVKNAASAAYDKNSGIIDKVLYYGMKGIKSLLGE